MKILWWRDQTEGVEVEEAQKMARLEKAEMELAELKRRAAEAITVLDDRQPRNHWREAIEQLIKGAF